MVCVVLIRIEATICWELSFSFSDNSWANKAVLLMMMMVLRWLMWLTLLRLVWKTNIRLRFLTVMDNLLIPDFFDHVQFQKSLMWEVACNIHVLLMPLLRYLWVFFSQLLIKQTWWIMSLEECWRCISQIWIIHYTLQPLVIGLWGASWEPLWFWEAGRYRNREAPLALLPANPLCTTPGWHTNDGGNDLDFYCGTSYRRHTAVWKSNFHLNFVLFCFFLVMFLF